jgi:hypothetical protein
MDKPPRTPREESENGGNSSSLYPALVSAGNSHVFAVLGNRPAGHANALLMKALGDLVVGERMARVFLFNHLLDEPLQVDE